MANGPTCTPSRWMFNVERYPSGAPGYDPTSWRRQLNYFERFKVRPGSQVKLKDIDPAFKDDHESYEEAAAEIARYVKRLGELQDMLYAERRRSLLICLQAL